MLVAIENRINELLRDYSGVSPLFVEYVICYLERDKTRLEGRDEFFHYIEYLRNLGIGKDSITVADASSRAWLIDDKYVDLELVEAMLHGCLQPVLDKYKIDRTGKLEMSRQLLNDVQSVKKLLERHLTWTNRPTLMGPAGAFEYYLLSLEAIICDSQPRLAASLALHFEEFLEKKFGGPGVVRRSLAEGNRIARTMSLLCEVWGEYINSIAQTLGHTDSSSSRDFVEKHWTVVVESAGG